MPFGQPGTVFQAIEFPSYRYVEFPKMLYQPGREVTVENREQQALLVGEWWETPACEGAPAIGGAAAAPAEEEEE